MNGEIGTEKKLDPSNIIKIHTHYLDYFFRIEQNEELLSEQRIKFFLAFSAIVVTLISISAFGDNKNSLLFFLSFLILFLFGLLIYARVIWSDRKIKQHRELWDIEYLVIHTFDPSIENYRKRLDEMNDHRIKSPLSIVKGTLTQIMGFTEVLLFAATFYFFGGFQGLNFIQHPFVLVVVSGLFALILSQWAMYIKKIN